MPRIALVGLVALLVVGAAIGPVLALSTADDQAGGDTFAMVTIDAPARSGQTTASVDVSRAVAQQHDAATTRLDEYTFEERIRGADDDERRRIAREELERIEDRVEDLLAEERALRRSYVDREIGTTEYAIGLARIDADASLLGERIDALSDRVGDEDTTTMARDVGAKLVGLDGPIRDRVQSAIRGEGSPIRIHAAASRNGTELSMIDDGRHVREAYRADRRTTDVTGTIPPGELFTLVNEFVSEDYEIEPQSTNIRGGIGGGLYVAVIEAPRTPTYLTLTTHIDGDTRQIFHEVQERRLSDLPTQVAVQNTTAGTTLAVNRTFSGGPLRVAAYDNATGEPVDKTVTVDGEQLRTGADGVLWTVAPRTYSFPVTAVQPGGNVTVQVRTLPVTGVGEGS